MKSAGKRQTNLWENYTLSASFQCNDTAYLGKSKILVRRSPGEGGFGNQLQFPDWVDVAQFIPMTIGLRSGIGSLFNNFKRFT